MNKLKCYTKKLTFIAMAWDVISCVGVHCRQPAITTLLIKSTGESGDDKLSFHSRGSVRK